jgi:hypothetical protein
MGACQSGETGGYAWVLKMRVSVRSNEVSVGI